MRLPGALHLGGRWVPLRVVRHPRARRMLLRVCAQSGEIRLTLPRHAGSREGLAFLEAQGSWLEATLARLVPEPQPFRPGSTLSVADERLTVAAGAGRAVLRQGAVLHVPGPEWRVNARVAAWLRHEAQRLLEAETRALAARLGRPVAAVAVRDPRTRWGSCSAAGRIAYSWRLILAPGFVRRTVVAHEVAHLAEPHHGPAFWRLAEDLLGESHAPARQWLRGHGPALHALGRAPAESGRASLPEAAPLG